MNKIVITNYENKRYIIFLKGDKPVKIRVLDNDNQYPDAVFVGCVRDVKKNIASSFVSYGNKQFGFLGKGDIKPGTLLPVIVKKRTESRKEDVLTDRISLCGVYVVIDADNSRAYKISDTDRSAGSNFKFSSKLKDDFKTGFLSYLASCDDDLSKYSVVVRSNAVNTDFESVVNEYKYLEKKLDRIIAYANTRTEGTLLHHGLSECLSYIASEDFSDYAEIETDDNAALDEINYFISEYNNEGIKVPVNVRRYDDKDYPLYKLISIKRLLSYALDKKVFLKSNAYISIEHTEALTVIDVNSSTTSFKGAKADVIHSVNMEAAEEIALQLKLRNISGIIIVDFINETNEDYKKELITHIKQLLKNDDSKAKFVSLTKLGLAELTRERRSKPLREQIYS